MNRKYGKLMQWTNEKLGKGQSTNLDQDFKAIEQDVNSRIEKFEKLHASFVSITKCNKGQLIGNFASNLKNMQESMQTPETEMIVNYASRAISDYGERLDNFEKQTQIQLLSTFEKLLSMIRGFQASRKRFEGKRLAYDYALSKSTKLKKDDPKLEEDMRISKYKYDDSLNDVSRKMKDILESDDLLMQSIQSYINDQLTLFQNCAEAMEKAQSVFKDNTSHKVAETHSLATNLSNARSSSSGSYGMQPTVLTLSDRAKTSASDHKYERLINNNSISNQFDSLDLGKNNSSNTRGGEGDSKEIYKVIYNFEPDDDTMMRLVIGEFVSIIKKHESGWYLGELCDDKGKIIKTGGRSGYFPVNHAALFRCKER